MPYQLPPSIATLRDAPLRVSLPERLEKAIAAIAPPSNDDPEELKGFLRSTIDLVDQVVGALDAENRRITEQRHKVGDANALRAREINEPKRQTMDVVSVIKSKLQNERAVWAQRFARQAAEVTETQVRMVRAMQVELVPPTTLRPIGNFCSEYANWQDTTFLRWGEHLAEILRPKIEAQIADDLNTLNGHLRQKLRLVWPEVRPLAPQLGAYGTEALEMKAEFLGPLGAFVDSLKNGLNSMAMMTGLLVIPVVGQFSDKQPTALRATIIAGFVVPVAVFAIFISRKHRRRQAEQNYDKARETFQRSLESAFKGRLERFRLAYDAAVSAYLAEAQQRITEQLVRAIDDRFSIREREIVRELAAVNLEADRMQDTLGAIRQLRGGLTQGLVVDLRRKLREVGG